MSASLSRQIAAVETAIKILTGQMQRPKPAVVTMTVEDAQAALETLRSLETSRGVKGQ